MKRIYTILAAVLITASVFAQTPEKMTYQSVIRNTTDQLVTNQDIGMQISILQGSASGTPMYVETHNTTTNANGLVTVEIGNGTVLSGDFTTIDWSNDIYFIKTETDPTTAGGTSYTITGTSQLLSVPYALHAKTAETISGGIVETDPVFTGSEANNITATDITNLSNLSGINTGDQDISSIVTNTQAIQDTASQIRADIPDVSGFVSTETDPVFTGSEANNITATDITNLSNLSGTNTGDQDISGIATNTQAIQDTASQIRADFPDVSGFITTETDPVFTTWNKDYADLTNKPQITDTISAVIDTTTQFVRTEIDGSVTNEIQTISRTGLTVALSNGGGTYLDSVNVYTAGDGIDITNNVISEHKYQVGDFAQGGIVFWLDETGEHGLVCAKNDQSTGVRWYAGTYGNTQAKGDGRYAGEANTSIIIAAHVAIGDDGNTYAARICNEFFTTTIEGYITYGDWYLPTINEWELIYQNKAIIDATAILNGGNALTMDPYWSSYEGNSNNAYYFNMTIGAVGSYDKIFAGYRVRAIRSF
jgi:hypothetical protein